MAAGPRAPGVGGGHGRRSPARIYHVGQYTIWYWPQNLLSTIRHQGEHLSGGTVMRAKGAIALLPLLLASGVTAGCSSDGPAVVHVSNVLDCGRVVDQDNTGYLGGPLTARRAIALLTKVQRSGGAARIHAGKLNAADRTILDIVAIDLLGYSGSKLSDDAAAFARSELRYSPNAGDRVDKSYARRLVSGIAALAKDCPAGANH